MNAVNENLTSPLELFEPGTEAVYPIDVAARLARVPRHSILVYCRYGMVTPAVDPESSGFYFDNEAIRVLRRIEYLRSIHGINLAGTRIILDLIKQVESLQTELRFLRE